jgi:two-component system, NarL family, nitrate/nitrite response regulator NarL
VAHREDARIAGRGTIAPRILLVDDHAVIVQAMAQAMRSAGFGDVAVVMPDQLDVAGVLALADEFRPDVALVDLNLGVDRSGLPIIGPLVGRGVAVVAFSATNEELVIAQCLEAGAVGFLNKGERFDVVVDYVSRVAAGEAVVPAAEREALLAKLREHRAVTDKRLRAFEELSPRERAVLKALLQGRSPQDVADEQYVSVKTVRSQIESIYRKLGVCSQLAAVALAREVGWPLAE